MSSSRTFFRIVFGAAAVYNLAFGVWAGFFPGSFFELFDLPPTDYPAIWSCLGMVVGTYAVAYAAIALDPEKGTLLAAIGLLGKVLGPIGWLHAVHTGQLPPRTFPLILFNDLIWWYPFLAYLVRDLPRRRTIVALAALAANATACLAILTVTPGTEAEPDVARRAEFVLAHSTRWSAVWFAWVLASTGLVAFFAQWSSRLSELGACPRTAWFGTAVVAFGACFDLSGEVINVAFLTRPGIWPEEYAFLATLYTLIGPGGANGLYCVGGLLLATLSWRHRFVRGPLGILGFGSWSVGLVLTSSAIASVMTRSDLAHQVTVVSGAGVMGMFLTWGAFAAWRFGPTGSVAACAARSA